MSISARVRDFIGQQQPGTVFLLSDIDTYNDARKATTKAVQYYLSHHDQPFGRVSKVANGLYYKDKIGLLGKLPPSFDAVIQALTYQNDSQVGYVVGHKLFNRLGLSTQVPTTVSVVTSKRAPTHIDFAGIKVEVQSKQQTIKPQDIKFLELAYVLNNVDKIQSLEGESIYNALFSYFETLYHQNDDQFKKLYDRLVYKRTKAIFGALLEYYQEQAEIDFSRQIDWIQHDLSDRSHYHVGYFSTFLDNRKRWHIR